jgi:polyisoprenoid-binding protein YceI
MSVANDSITTTSLTRTVDGLELPLPGTYALDPAHTDVGFSVRHLMVSRVKGRFAEVSGTVEIGEDPTASAVDVTIRAASIDSRDEQRDAHLRSPDFLDTDRHPVLRFRSNRVERAGDRWLVDGELTIRDVTRPVQLEATFEGAARSPWGGLALGFSITATIDREDFGLTWNQALETGGVLVGKSITIQIDAELNPA